MPNATPPDQTIPVTLTVQAGTPPKLSINRTAVTLAASQDGEPRAETVVVSNGGSGNLNFNASISGASWLTVSPSSGTVTTSSPASLTLNGDPRGLQVGSYSARVIISSSAGEEATVNVVMTVTSARQSMLLSQSGLSYAAVAQGGAVPPQSFGVLNIGSGVMGWTAAASTLSGGSWLSISRTSGSADSTATDVQLIDVGVNGTNLAPGEYHGQITVSAASAANSPQIVSVILRVLATGSDPVRWCVQQA